MGKTDFSFSVFSDRPLLLIVLGLYQNSSTSYSVLLQLFSLLISSKWEARDRRTRSVTLNVAPYKDGHMKIVETLMLI